MAGPCGANASRANTLSLADTKGGKNLSEQVICTKSAGNGADLCVDAPEVFCQQFASLTLLKPVDCLIQRGFSSFQTGDVALSGAKG